MMNCMACWNWVGYGLVWWLVASFLLFWSWNKVVSPILGTKEAKYWQAMIFVLTTLVLCWPHHQFDRCMKGCDKASITIEETESMPAPNMMAPGNPAEDNDEE